MLDPHQMEPFCFTNRRSRADGERLDQREGSVGKRSAGAPFVLSCPLERYIFSGAWVPSEFVETTFCRKSHLLVRDAQLPCPAFAIFSLSGFAEQLLCWTTRQVCRRAATLFAQWNWWQGWVGGYVYACCFQARAAETGAVCCGVDGGT